MGRESGSTHTNNSAFLDTVQDLFFRQILKCSRNKLYFLILLVIIYDDCINHCPCSIQSLLDALDGTGYRCMLRYRYKSACIGNLLSCKNLVTFFDTRNRWSSNVLRHQIDHISLWEILLNRLVLCQFLTFVRSVFPYIRFLLFHELCPERPAHVYFLSDDIAKPYLYYTSFSSKIHYQIFKILCIIKYNHERDKRL